MGFLATKIKKKSVSKKMTPTCENCTLSKLEHKNPKMEPTGAVNPLIYILGEAPGFDEDQEGRQFIGKAGRFLREVVNDRTSSNIYSTIRWNNCVRCRPYEGNSNRTPTNFEISCCKESLIKDIEQSKPAIIWAFGNVPLTALGIGKKITLWRGRRVPIKLGNHKCWVQSFFHPSYVLRSRNMTSFESEIEHCFKYDIAEALNFIMEEYEEPEVIDSGYKNDIATFLGNKEEDYNSIIEILDALKTLDSVTIDIETNKKRPYLPDARILSCSIGTDEFVVSFPLFHKEAWKFDNSIPERLMKDLYNFFIQSNHKVVHNLKFELEWFYNYYKDQKFMRETKWDDTMIQASLLNEKTSKEEKMLSLDILTKVHFGFNLKELNNLNMENLEDEKLEDLLIYNGMDVKYTHLLFEKQKQLLEYELSEIYNSLINTTTTIVLTQNRGINIDNEKLEELHNKYQTELDKLKNKIFNSKEVEQFNKEKEVEFNPNSTQHMIYLLTKILELKIDTITKKGNLSVNVEVLEKFAKEGVEFAQWIIDMRKYGKLISTYLDPMKDLTINGILNPQFNVIGGTKSGRLSSGKEAM